MSGMASPLARAADARDAATQAAALVRLRWGAVVAQLVVFASVDRWLHIMLPWRPLLAGVVVLALVNGGIQIAARRGRIAPLTPMLALDIGVLSWQLYWAGGPANPFVSLYLVPIALAAAWRSARAVVATALLAVFAYSALWFGHAPLPHVHGEFDLHLFGMWVNFLISTGAVGWVGVRVATTMAAQRAELAAARERSLRDEGVLAVATLGAGAAHALNTPLATMAVLVADLRDGATADTRADLDLIGRQLDACRDAVRQLVAEAQPHPAAETATLTQRVASAVSRWRLLRPAFELDVQVDAAAATRSARFDRAFELLLVNLLNNAADAAEANARCDVRLRLSATATQLHIEVEDGGSGFATAPRAFVSGKRDGLGLGLTLAALICERHGGSLDIDASGGSRVRATLAWAEAEG